MLSHYQELGSLRKRLAAFGTLQAIARELSGPELDLETLLKKILGAAMQVSSSTAGSLLLYEATTDELVFKVILGGGGEALKETRLRADQGIAGSSFATQRPVIVDEAENDARHFGATATSVGMRVRQLMAVPLLRQSNAIGVLEVMNPTSGENYTPDDAQLLMSFAAHSAIAIENAILYGQVQQERDRILSVEAAVRHELACDLHDGPTQMLASLIMEIRYLRESNTRDPEHTQKGLDQIEELAQKALYQTRNILFDLRPVILEQQGVGRALEQYVAWLRTVELLPITLDVASLRTRLDPKVETAIFSIVQEAVNNAKKHANASNVWIDAVENKDTVTISICDDGRGFDMEETRELYGHRGSLGLLNMRERAAIAKGDLEINSHVGEGTRVRLVVPRRPKSDDGTTLGKTFAADS